MMRQISEESAELFFTLLGQVNLSGADPDLVAKATSIETARAELLAVHGD